MKPVNLKSIEKMAEKYSADKVQKVLRYNLYKNDIANMAVVMESYQRTDNKFSLEIPTMEVTNQKSSGRCWLFAGLNLLREEVAKNCNLKFFELSQNYMAYCDKLEKANYYMENILEHIDCEWDDRVFSFLNHTPIQDGGQWDMFVSLVKKYGVMPKDAMGETFQSSNTAKMNSIIATRLRRFTADVQKLHAQHKDSEIASVKETCLQQIYNLLTSCFGLVPTHFDFEYVDKRDVYHCDKNLTPVEFYKKYVKIDLNKYLSIINAPTKDKPYNKTYTVQCLGNVVGGNQIKYLNLPINEVKELVIKQLQAKELVWFGSDCGKFGVREDGLWDDEAIAYADVLEMDLCLTKDQGLDYAESAMNHAMVICGVNLDEGKPTRWKIQNSWGGDRGKKGYFVASDSWFDKYVYQVIINHSHLSAKQEKDSQQEPIKLQPWDPMGTLAE